LKMVFYWHNFFLFSSIYLNIYIYISIFCLLKMFR
jgi:hypothetical protein